jgi:hypothetical protein
MVRAKFRCTAIKQAIGWNGPNSLVDVVELSPGTGPGNEEWSKYTPAGKLEMTITNPDAISQFKVGEYYFVDFTPAPAAG